MSLFRLFLIFTKIGAILLGGGYVILPILKNEIVEKRKLISQDELVEFFAISQSLPGIVAANISMFIGYKLRGKSGALAAMFGIIFVPFFIIISLASVLPLFFGSQIVQGFMWGIGIAVIALIFLASRDVWQCSKRDLFFYLIFLLSLVLLLIFKLSPIVVIISVSALGVGIKFAVRYKK